MVLRAVPAGQRKQQLHDQPGFRPGSAADISKARAHLEASEQEAWLAAAVEADTSLPSLYLAGSALLADGAEQAALRAWAASCPCLQAAPWSSEDTTLCGIAEAQVSLLLCLVCTAQWPEQALRVQRLRSQHAAQPPTKDTGQQAANQACSTAAEQQAQRAADELLHAESTAQHASAAARAKKQRQRQRKQVHLCHCAAAKQRLLLASISWLQEAKLQQRSSTDQQPAEDLPSSSSDAATGMAEAQPAPQEQAPEQQQQTASPQGLQPAAASVSPAESKLVAEFAAGCSAAHASLPPQLQAEQLLSAGPAPAEPATQLADLPQQHTCTAASAAPLHAAEETDSSPAAAERGDKMPSSPDISHSTEQHQQLLPALQPAPPQRSTADQQSITHAAHDSAESSAEPEPAVASQGHSRPALAPVTAGVHLSGVHLSGAAERHVLCTDSDLHRCSSNCQSSASLAWASCCQADASPCSKTWLCKPASMAWSHRSCIVNVQGTLHLCASLLAAG